LRRTILSCAAGARPGPPKLPQQHAVHDRIVDDALDRSFRSHAAEHARAAYAPTEGSRISPLNGRNERVVAPQANGLRPVKSLPIASDGPAYVVAEAGEKYLSLLGAARDVASQIARTPQVGLIGAADYIHRASRELAAIPPPDGPPLPPEDAIFECVRRLL